MTRKFKKEDFQKIRDNCEHMTTKELQELTGMPHYTIAQFLWRHKLSYKKLRTSNNLDEVENYIQKHYKDYRPSQIASQTGVSVTTVYAILHKNGLFMDRKCMSGEAGRRKLKRMPSETIFNVHERENWLV
jgi:hypothetical protein